MDAAMWQQAVLAVAAMSEENQGLLDQHLGPCIHSTFCLAPAQSQDSQHASLDAQILLPFTASQEVARRRKAVGRIVCLSRFLTPSSMLEVSRFREGNFFLFQAKPLQFLGQLMGHLTLSRAEKDQEISCGAAEALRAVHGFVLLREACYAAREDPKLRVERERPSTLWAEEPADEATVFGRFLFQTERSSFLLTVLRGIVHPRVSDVQLIASVLEAVLRYPCSELNKVEEVVWTIHAQLACVSQKPLADVLMKTLLQVALLYPQRVTAGLLQASPCCDSTARAMWSSLASEPCLRDDVLKTLLRGPAENRPAVQHRGRAQLLRFPGCSRCHARDPPAALQPMLRAVTFRGALHGGGLPGLLQLEWHAAGLLQLWQSEQGGQVSSSPHPQERGAHHASSVPVPGRRCLPG
ncbi:uncharacterized protein J5F26_016523 isoform 2-T3 [Ciconia maguari]